MFDFDNGMSENLFSHSYFSYMANETLQGEKEFYFNNCLFEFSCSHAKMRSKSAPQKLDFVKAKAISKSYTLDYSCKCPCMLSHS